MKKVWQLFVGDLKRLRGNVVTVIIVIGLVALPSIFSWYNMIAAWDVFGNTGNLKIAVASVDEGYESDLVPVNINIGEQVVSTLRANNQIKWVFTDKEDAIDGARSGKYYAAVVIPESFSRDMMTFYSDDVQHAKIIYYSNEKKNAISPKVTDQGADAISVQVNQVFAETLSDTALSLAQGFVTYADNADADGRIGDLADHMESLSSQMKKASSIMRTYSSVLASSQDLIGSSAQLLSSTKDSASEVGSQVSEMKDSADDIAEAMRVSTAALSQALSSSSDELQDVSTQIDAALDATDATKESTADALNAAADGLGEQSQNYYAMADALAGIEDSVPADMKPSIVAAEAALRSTGDNLHTLQMQLYGAAMDMDYTDDIGIVREQIDQQIEEAKQAVSDAKNSYDTNVKPHLDSLVSSVTDASSLLSSSAQKLNSASSSIAGSAGSISEQLGKAKDKLDASADALDSSAQKLSDLAANMQEALASGNVELLREVLSGDTSALATAISAPVQLSREALFPVENFGSAMSPLYTTLALWIGALVIMVTIRPTPSERIKEELGGVSLPQQFLGRFGIVSLLTFAQGTLLALGNMLFLGVQVNDPLLYMLCYWVSGQVFAFIIYTLVLSFANLGKAIAVILLILQVAGGGGAYPLSILPQFFQDVSAWLPATHVINAMRAAMFGVYQGDFWIELGLVLLYLVPFALLGLVLRNPTMKLINWYVEQVEKSHIA